MTPWHRLPKEAAAAPSLGGQVVWGLEQPGLVEGVPIYGWEFEPDYS